MAKGNATLAGLLRYNPLYYYSVRGLLRRFDNMDESQRRIASDQLLQRTLRWAAPEVSGGNTSDRLKRWPILEKSTIRDNEKNLVRRRIFSIPAATGGTTGIPIRVWRGLRNIAAEQAFIDHILTTTGRNFRTARIAVLRTEYIKEAIDRSPPFGEFTQGGKRLILSSRHLGPATVEWYVEALTEFSPDILWIYPSAGESLALNMLEKDLTLDVPYILTSSEVLHSSARLFLMKTFNAQIIDLYGLTERTALAYSYQPDEYFFHPLYGHVELLPLPNEGTGDTGRAEIIATGYWNEAMPLIRYRTGDQVIYPMDYSAADLALAGLGLKPVLGIVGRASDYLISPRGELLVGMSDLPGEIDNVLRLQIIQKSPHAVLIKVLPAPGFSLADRQDIVRNARTRLSADMSVEIEEADELFRLPSGKVPFIIRQPIE